MTSAVEGMDQIVAEGASQLVLPDPEWRTKSGSLCVTGITETLGERQA